MAPYKPVTVASIGILLLIVLASSGSIALGETVELKGMIKARSGATMIVQATDSPSVVVLLTDTTQVGQVQGVLKARRKEMSMAALIPGLEVQIEGTYNDLKQLVANSVKFQGNDLERAQSIQAGLHPTQAELKVQSEVLKEQQEKLAAGKATIDAAVARFGQLDDYYIFDEVTVLFGNGKSAIEPEYQPQLVQLAEKAKTIEAYMIQVIGYASSVGNATVNQKLSEDRAHNVTNFLSQQGNIPLTNVLAPGAMGESRQVGQVGDDQSAEAQANNRRVVVRVLQNKGIAGLQSVR